MHRREKRREDVKEATEVFIGEKLEIENDLRCYNKPTLPVVEKRARKSIHKENIVKQDECDACDKKSSIDTKSCEAGKKQMMTSSLLNDDIIRRRDSYMKEKLDKIKQRVTAPKTFLETKSAVNLKAGEKSKSHMESSKDHLNKHSKEEIVFHTLAEHQRHCSYESKSLPPPTSKTMPQLIKRMREQMRILLEQQLDMEHKIVTNEVIARDIANKLSKLAGDEEVSKFNLHVQELDSVNNLIQGLAARLAKVEENFVIISNTCKSEKDSEMKMFLLKRKKEKLEAQLSEAQWIKNNIDRRSRKVSQLY